MKVWLTFEHMDHEYDKFLGIFDSDEKAKASAQWKVKSNDELLWIRVAPREAQLIADFGQCLSYYTGTHPSLYVSYSISEWEII